MSELRHVKRLKILINLVKLLLYSFQLEVKITSNFTYDAGADDYISKPVKPKILLKKISNIAKKISSENAKDY